MVKKMIKKLKMTVEFGLQAIMRRIRMIRNNNLRRLIKGLFTIVILFGAFGLFMGAIFGFVFFAVPIIFSNIYLMLISLVIIFLIMAWWIGGI